MTHPPSTFSRTAVPRPSTAVLPVPEISLRNATRATLPRTTGSTAVWAYRRPSRGASSLTAARSGFGVRWADASAGTNTTGTNRSRSEIVEGRLLYMSSIPSKKWNLASGDSGARP